MYGAKTSGARPSCPQLWLVQTSLLRRFFLRSSSDRASNQEVLQRLPVSGDMKVIKS